MRVTAFLARTFGKNIWREHESRAHSEPCSRNNGTPSQWASGDIVRIIAFWQEHLTRTFGKNTKSRAHSEQCSRNNGTRSQRASGVHLRLFAVLCVSLQFWHSPAAVLLFAAKCACIAHRLTQIFAHLLLLCLQQNCLQQAPCSKFAPVRSGARTSAVCAARGFHGRRKRGRSRRRRGLCATKFARCAELCVQLHYRREFAARK